MTFFGDILRYEGSINVDGSAVTFHDNTPLDLNSALDINLSGGADLNIRNQLFGSGQIDANAVVITFEIRRKG